MDGIQRARRIDSRVMSLAEMSTQAFLHTALDQQIPLASGLSMSLGFFGTVGGLGSLGSLGSLGLAAVGPASLDRNMGVLQIFSLKDPNALLSNLLTSLVRVQISLSTARTKTKLYG
ncbi:hypothetical protein KP509_07G098900 [Ceratopteris richardii]|uniref:Uncharacterized protein n=1 Tax=Ceratopteris richardii TaxID=49495 RepID=A0A8T2UDJ9_CERRI|nr:hypothetical protein KP509_07G098900 [Ceratopteris richardii]